MGSDSEANQAIEKLHGTDYGGRPMKVNEARPKDDKGGRRNGGGNGGYGRGGRW
jgi:cold-inducible RNA-binding protein